jgi:hypothetical protein
MYRENPGSDKDSWPYHIDIDGTPGRMDWGQLVAAVWKHQSTDKSAEEVARLIAAAPALLLFVRGFLHANPKLSPRHPLSDGFERSKDEARKLIESLDAKGAVPECNAHDDLVAALRAMLETHGMHGPCKMNSCSECKYAAKKAEAALAKAIGTVPA